MKTHDRILQKNVLCFFIRNNTCPGDAFAMQGLPALLEWDTEELTRLTSILKPLAEAGLIVVDDDKVAITPQGYNDIREPKGRWNPDTKWIVY
jgi:hypothetical protein